MRNPYGEVLPVDTVMALADEAAGQLEIRIKNTATLRKKISKPEPLPMIYRGKDVVLWVDRFYIAFADDDAPWIQYLYLTRQHIIEERIAQLREQRQRGTRTPIPAAIRWQFSAAWREMNRVGKAYALRPLPWTQGGKTLLDLKPSVGQLISFQSFLPDGWPAGARAPAPS